MNIQGRLDKRNIPVRIIHIAQLLDGRLRYEYCTCETSETKGF